MFTVDGNFIGEFKTGDNINYNLDCLRVMYKAQGIVSKDDGILLCKPIIVTETSIIEALLYDMFFRINKFTREGLGNVAEAVLKKIRSKNVDQLETLIAVSKKHELLGPKTTGIYENLDNLRRIRN
ncbi:hypothetical protein ONV78_30500 [Hahella sp. CR1]|uniref:hypothetical protein n=1 Tax=Hahella sp. CR1 TaxID=2992807 RepID=UPI002442CE6B|nr:hypothetical protein [Hahella sp. CR1]MDG9672103.1 hypothetical protein [Hahella sp. CR1]